MIKIDVRGFSCPIPVVKTQKAMQDNPKDTLTVLVETEVSKENVSRLAESREYSIEEKTASEDEYVLTLIPPQR